MFWFILWGRQVYSSVFYYNFLYKRQLILRNHVNDGMELGVREADSSATAVRGDQLDLFAFVGLPPLSRDD